ncbi:MAG: sulfotransferase [Parvularculaceae bacterium]
MADAQKASAAGYSALDRLIHRIAFANPHVQRAVGEIENDIFAARLKGHEAKNPVFVTGLPRAGTTLTLEALYSTGEFRTFTYRHMPFVLAPLFWTSVTGGFRKKAVAMERAHGDGMEVSFDSPEAFEEVAWLTYLRNKYMRATSIAPLEAAAVTPEFENAFRTLIKKLTAPEKSGGLAFRYLSKNNANIGRIGALRKLFPDATIIVCLREPLAHVASLMTQHERFLGMHDEDAFSKSYMEWIGHYDFGDNFKPIDFASCGGVQERNSLTRDFWLQYWIDAYAFAEKHSADNVLFLDYDRLFEDAQSVYRALASATGVEETDKLIAAAERIRPATTTIDEAPENAGLLAEARALHQRLRSLSLGA